MAPAPARPNDWLHVLTRYGLGTLLAIFLVWKLADVWDSKLNALALTLDRHVEDTSALIGLMRGVCHNTATTAAEHSYCDEVGRR